MDPQDFFRAFFGIKRFVSLHLPRKSYLLLTYVNNFRPQDRQPPSSSNDEINEDAQRNSHRDSFHVFSNPLHMESFFNQQLDEIMKQFGFGNFSGNNTLHKALCFSQNLTIVNSKVYIEMVQLDNYNFQCKKIQNICKNV